MTRTRRAHGEQQVGGVDAHRTRVGARENPIRAHLRRSEGSTLGWLAVGPGPDQDAAVDTQEQQPVASRAREVWRSAKWSNMFSRVDDDGRSLPCDARRVPGLLHLDGHPRGRIAHPQTA
jgi:hypothetical protein